MNRSTQLARQFSSLRENELPGVPVIHLSVVRLVTVGTIGKGDTLIPACGSQLVNRRLNSGLVYVGKDVKFRRRLVLVAN